MDETAILIPFLNRAGEFNPLDQFQLVPKGVFPISRKEGDKVRSYLQVVDDTACEKIVTAFKNRKAKNPGHQMLVGFEHFAHEQGKSSEAACWISELEVKPDGVWAKGTWTDIGEAAIKNRRYRYLSPVWFPRQTEPIAGNRFRPVDVNDAGLTNMPNLGDALQPFWNRADSFHGHPATIENQTTNTAMKDRLIQLFKMDATATDEQVLAKAQAFMNRASEMDTLSGTHATLKSDHEALKNRHNTLLEGSVTRALEDYQGVITQESKDAWKNRLTADFDGTVVLLKGIKAPAATKKAPVHKPGTAAAAAADAHADNAGAEEDPFLNRVNELTAGGKLSKADAELQICRDEPALYEAYRRNLLGLEEKK